MNLNLEIQAKDLFRGLSIAGHAILGANAALRVGASPLTGIPSALVLESLANSNLAHSEAGGIALAAGYAPFAVANMDLKPLSNWANDWIDRIVTPIRNWWIEQTTPIHYDLIESPYSAGEGSGGAANIRPIGGTVIRR